MGNLRPVPARGTVPLLALFPLFAAAICLAAPSLEWADNQLGTVIEVKSRPVEIWDGCEDKCAQVGSVGGSVGFSVEQGFGR